MTNFKALALLSILLIAQTTSRTLSNLLSSASASPDGSSTSINQKVSFLAYVAKYGKSYSSTADFQSRLNNWIATDNYIKSFTNSQVALQHNKFSDWSQQEKSAVLNSKLAGAPSADSQASKILNSQGKLLAGPPSCSYGSFFNAATNACVPCPAGCQSCLNTTVCYACATSNFALKNNVCVCQTGPLNGAGTDCGTCLSSQFLDLPSNSCKNCNQNNVNCATCTQSNVCTSCKNGWTLTPNTVNPTCQCVKASNTTTANVDANGYCVQCQSNQAFNGGQCQNCPQYCNSCTSNQITQAGAGNATFCTQCAPGFVLSRGACACPSGQTVQNGQCVNNVVCPKGSFAQADNTCAPCQPFCASCAPLTGQCLSCIDMTFRIVNATDSPICPTCQPIFQNVPQGQCRCPAGFALSPLKNSCLKIDSCPRGFYYSTAPGQFNCQPCSSATNNLCASCNAFTGFCNQTVDPTVLINGTTGIPYCPSQTFLKNNKCIAMIQCPRNLYNDGQNNCLNCSSNCLQCQNITGFCTQCADTFTIDPQTKTNCRCLITQFLDIGTNNYTGQCVNLTKCPPGQYNLGWNNCSSCVQNCTSCMDFSGQCNQCAPSFYQKGNSCICNPDPTKQFFDKTSGLCIDVDLTICPQGQYNKGDNTCGNCPKNCTSCDILTGFCNQCESSKYTFYQPKGQAPYCACAYGQYWNEAQNDCNDCNSDVLSQTNALALPNAGKCTACHGSCFDCEYTQVALCDVCPPNLQLISYNGNYGDKNFTYCGCISGFYVEQTTQSCQKCQWQNCQECSQAGGCLKCEPTYSLFYINGAIDGPQYCDCDYDNFYGFGKQILVNGQCQYIQDCGDNYYTDLKTNQCASCPFADCATCNNDDPFHTCQSCLNGLVLAGDKQSCNPCKKNVAGEADEYWHNEYEMCLSCSDSVDGFGDQCQTCGYDFPNKIYRCFSCTDSKFAKPVVTPAADGNPATATTCATGQCNKEDYYPDDAASDESGCSKCPNNLKLSGNKDSKALCTVCPHASWDVIGTGDDVECICQQKYCADDGNSPGSKDNEANCKLNDPYTQEDPPAPSDDWIPFDPWVKSFVDDLDTQVCNQTFAWQDCPQGWYNPGDNNCKRCKANCTKCLDYSGYCIECSNGQMDLFDNNTCGCRAGRYAESPFGDNVAMPYSLSQQPFPAQWVAGNQPNGTLASCKACPANCTSCSDNTGICLTCIPGYTLKVDPDNNMQVSCVCDGQFWNAPVVYASTYQTFYGGERYQGSGVCLRWNFCKAGQWATWNFSLGMMTCAPCGDKCASCDMLSGQCRSCINNDYYFQDDGYPGEEASSCACPPEKYSFNNTCQPCPDNCTTCEYNTGKCLSCREIPQELALAGAPYLDFTLDNGRCTCPGQAFVSRAGDSNKYCQTWKSDCGDGKYNDGGNNCLVCPDVNAVTCADFTGQTLSCRTNMQYNANNWTCTCPWVNGRKQFQYYNASNPLDTKNNFCTECSKNCTACMDGSGNCTSCVATYALNVPTSGVCQCDPNTTPAQIGGLAPDGDGTLCAAWLNCGYARWNPGNNVCRNCSQYAINCTDWFGVTTKCYDQSMYLDIWANNSLTNFGTNPYSYGVCGCTQNQYLAPDLTCRQCQPNCITCAQGTGACTKCAAGFFPMPDGSCGCNGNQFLINGKCAVIQSCPAGSYNPGNNVCVPCADQNAGICAINTGKTLTCKASYSLSAAGVCTCAVGSFNNGTGCQLCSKFCTSCQDLTGKCLTCSSTYTLQANYTCACMANQYSVNSTSQCIAKTNCPAGKFNLGNNACQNCPAGCSSCSDIWGTCTGCSNPTASLVNGVCLNSCPIGQFNPGNNVCTSCASQNQNCSICSSSGSCTQCAPGFTLNAGKCGCNSNQYLIGGVCRTKLICPFNQYNRGDNTCAFCPANCSTCAAITGACTLCKGWGVINYNTGTCSCPSGYIMINGVCSISYQCNNDALPYKQYNVGNNTCQDCIAVTPNCASCADYTGTCTKCNDGFFLNKQNQCVPCSSTRSNCNKCTDITGYCNTCRSGYILLAQDGSCSQNKRLLHSMDNCDYKVGPVNNATICLNKPASSTRVVPEFKKTDQSVDWRTWNVVGSVKDQGSCASDFAFSSTGAAESAYAIKTGKLFDLSEQFLVDCDTSSFGCSGGYPTTSSALLSTSGAIQESDYPYTGKQSKCHSQDTQSVFKLQYPGSQQIQQSKDSFKDALRQGPISVNFGVSDDTFWYYSKGILPAALCQKGKLNHAMLAVGYGVEGKVEYALIQNTFGTGWGEDGLIRVELTNDSYGPCGLYAQSARSLV